MSSMPDVGVIFELQVARERFKADLDGMKMDFDQWRQQATSASIEIPVRLRDEATSQLTSLMQSLQAQASAGISIPINVGGGGEIPGGGSGMSWGGPQGWGVPSGPGMIGPGPGRMNQMFGPGENTMRGSRAVFSRDYGPSSYPLMQYEEFGDPWNKYGGGFQNARMSQPQESGGGGFQGLRMMAAAGLAVAAVERIQKSASYAFDSQDPEQSNVQFLKQRERQLREIMGSSTGLGRRAFNALDRVIGIDKLPGFATGGFDDRADLLAIQRQIVDTEAHDRNVRRVQLSQRTMREEGFADSMGRQNPLGSFMSREMAGGAAAAMSGQGGGEFGGADARIDAEHEKQMESIRKRIQHLREQGISEQALTQEMTSLTNSAGIMSQVDRDRVNAQRTLFRNETTVMQTRASGNYALAVEQERGAAEAAIRIQFGNTPMADERIAAMRASNTAGDQTRGWNLQMGAEQSGLSFDGNSLGAAYVGIAQWRMNAEQQDPSNTDSIRLVARERWRQAQMTESDRLQTMSDTITESGIDNPYEARRSSIRNAASRQSALRPELASQTSMVANAQIAQINREEDRLTRQNNESVMVSQMRSGNPLIGGEWLHGRSLFRGGHGPNPEESQALSLQFDLQRQLRQHAGADAHDIQLRDSIRSVGAEQARQLLSQTSDPAARRRLEGLIRKNYSSGTADSDGGDNGASGAGAIELASAAEALRKAAEAISGAKALYVVK